MGSYKKRLVLLRGWGRMQEAVAYQLNIQTRTYPDSSKFEKQVLQERFSKKDILLVLLLKQHYNKLLRYS